MGSAVATWIFDDDPIVVLEFQAPLVKALLLRYFRDHGHVLGVRVSPRVIDSQLDELEPSCQRFLEFLVVWPQFLD